MYVLIRITKNNKKKKDKTHRLDGISLLGEIQKQVNNISIPISILN
jgi:hypothetical protein